MITFDYTHITTGSWKSRFKVFEFKCLWNQKRCSLKQRYDRFSFVGDQIHATATSEQTWANPGHTVLGGSQKSKE